VPQFAAGHSLGELTALTCAGALDIRDALRIIRQRGLLMKDAVAPGAGRMSAVIGVPAAKIDEVCQAISTAAAPVAVANLNTPKQTVISGAAAAVEAAGRELEQLGAKVVSLKVSGPFHCPLMQPAAERFAQVWKGVPLRPLAFPVVSNVTAFLYREAADVPDMLSRQLLNPVRWNDSMQFLRNQNVDVFIDVGPGSILKRMVSESEIPGTVFSLDLDADRAALRSLKESQYVGVITRCMAAAVCTRNQNFDDQEYRLGVIEPYRQLEHLHETLDESKRQPTEHEMRDAVALLKKILTTKKLSRDELEGRVERIFDETGTRGLLA
jgi:[acyl-carrier-protein] S-malonyltransferase